jgi:hypothetical protein
MNNLTRIPEPNFMFVSHPFQNILLGLSTIVSDTETAPSDIAK